MGRRGAATLEEAEARMLSRKHAHEQLNGKLAALAAKGTHSRDLRSALIQGLRV